MDVDEGDLDVGAVLGPDIPAARQAGGRVDKARVVGRSDGWVRQDITLSLYLALVG